jgi:hypothetical protein
VSADFRQLHPLSAFLAPWLKGRRSRSRCAESHRRRARHPDRWWRAAALRPPRDDGEGYEERAWRCGEVATRTDNRHDLFNALIWLAFPRSKAAMNRRHHEALLAARAAGSEARGPLRDALTQFDECGVIVAGAAPELWQGLVRPPLARGLRRASRGNCCAPRALSSSATPATIAGRALRRLVRQGAVHRGRCWRGWSCRRPNRWPNSMRGWRRRLATGDFAPRDWQPLPLLGIPGATAENEHAAYYEDERQFRPPRRMRAGSSPGNR